jgi:hypothetical protein
MAQAIDILVEPVPNTDADLHDTQIRDGDFVLGPSDNQHMDDILLSYKGHWRQDPLIGVGLPSYQQARNTSQVLNGLRKTISAQIKRDGYRVRKIELKSLADIIIDAERIQ